MFDSLETMFSPNHTATANAMLKALNNRKYIYFVTLKLEQSVFQAREKRLQEEKGWCDWKEAIHCRAQWMLWGLT